MRWRGRRIRWSLRSLFVLTTLCAVGLAVVVPYHRERRAIDWLELCNSQITFEQSAPDWLCKLLGEKWFQHVARVEYVGFGPCDVDYLPLTADEVVAVFGSLPKLYSLDVGRMDTTDETLPALGRLSSLKQLSLGGRCKCSMGAIEEFAEAHPDCDLDVALAETLIAHVNAANEIGTFEAPESLFCLQTALKWKLACANFKKGPQPQAAARRQYLSCLERLCEQLDALAKDNIAVASPFARALIRCAVAEARLSLAFQRVDKPTNTVVAENETRANELIDLIEKSHASRAIQADEAIDGLQLAADALVAGARAHERPHATRLALRRLVTACRQLVEQFSNSSDDIDSSRPFLRARLALAKAEAALAREEGNVTAEREILEAAQDDERNLRSCCESLLAFDDRSLLKFAHDWCQADELQFALAQAVGDESTPSLIQRARIEALSRRVTGECGLIRQGHLSHGNHLLTVLIATAILETAAGNPLRQPITDFGPGQQLLWWPEDTAKIRDGETVSELDFDISVDDFAE